MRPIVQRFNGLLFYNSLYEGGVCDRRHANTGMVPAHTKSLIDAVTGFTLRVDPEKLIQGYPFLQTLALWSANVRDEGAAAVGAFLATNRSLTALEVRGNRLSQLDPIAFRACAPTLRYLGLASNRKTSSASRY